MSFHFICNFMAPGILIVRTIAIIFIGYWQEGFLSLQKAIDVAVQKHLSNSTSGPMLMVYFRCTGFILFTYAV